jgi:hypothetical protein
MLVEKDGKGRWIIDFTCKGRRISALWSAQ